MNLDPLLADVSGAHATFVGSHALSAYLQIQGVAGVGNGNSDVDSKTRTRKAGQPGGGRLVSGGGFTELPLDQKVLAKREAAGKCGAMSEQGADSGRGNEQLPQKLVHLVGTRDSAPRQPWIRPRSA